MKQFDNTYYKITDIRRSGNLQGLGTGTAPDVEQLCYNEAVRQRRDYKEKPKPRAREKA